MTKRYYGERQAIQHGGSIRVTIPSDAVGQLDIDAGDHIAVYGDDGVLMLVPQTDEDGGDDR